MPDGSLTVNDLIFGALFPAASLKCRRAVRLPTPVSDPPDAVGLPGVPPPGPPPVGQFWTVIVGFEFAVALFWPVNAPVSVLVAGLHVARKAAFWPPLRPTVRLVSGMSGRLLNVSDG